MFFSSQHNEPYSRSFLPDAFEQALLQVNENEGFGAAVTFAASQAGCEFLFEVPAQLFNHSGGRAAVIRSCPADDDSQDSCVLFVIFDGEDGVIRILEEFEAPASVLAMTSSYSNFLEIMTKTNRPLH